ncbi:hypothetical protein ACFL9T_10290 [Thermodesulfobacteriota bacterium]
MIDFLMSILALGLIFQAFIGLTFLISCIWENEKRATFFAALQFLGMLSLVIAFFILKAVGFFDTVLGIFILIVALLAGCVVAFFLLRRTPPNEKAVAGTRGLVVGEVKRFDEREHVFARNRSLRPDSEQYRQFYGENPEYEDFDTRRRERGGPLGHPGVIDRPHDGPNVAATLASLTIPLALSAPERVKPLPHPELKGKRLELSPEEATARVKGYTLHLGADLVGITEVNPDWVYSYKGEIFHNNWDDWGKEIELKHTYAIIFAEEMSFRLTGPAPHTPTTIESMVDYAKGAYISTQLAGFIANMGYSAAANHLRHYESILPPLAVDAGLGEVGRLGYLMTKEFGPRIRLSAVTTDLPLVADKPADIGVEDFCRICKKCAVCCPSNSIPMEDQAEVNGTLRWKLNDQTCFDYWGKIGTDCCICMKVCPWSHARTFPHRVIVALITRNGLARRLFSLMDDIFYGKKPKPKPAPQWARFGPWKTG